MNCLDFLDRLGDLVAGRASAAERDEAERHAAGCAECGALLRAARSGHGSLADAGRDDAADDLVASVLARTAGPACARAEDLLCDYVDGELPAEEQSLVAEHLAHCPRCAALAEALDEATLVLPLLAEMEPDGDFALQVLNATSRSPQAVAAHRPAAWSRVAAWWERAIARPRFAFEVAYVATLLLLLIAGNPASTLQAASAHTSAASARFERATATWSSALSDLVVSSPAWRAAQHGVGVLRSSGGATAGGAGFLSRLSESAASAWSWLQGVMSSAIDLVADGWARIRKIGAELFQPRGPEPGRQAVRS